MDEDNDSEIINIKQKLTHIENIVLFSKDATLKYTYGYFINKYKLLIVRLNITS